MRVDHFYKLGIYRSWPMIQGQVKLRRITLILVCINCHWQLLVASINCEKARSLANNRPRRKENYHNYSPFITTLSKLTLSAKRLLALFTPNNFKGAKMHTH